MQVQSVDSEDPLEEGMATHSSILAWGIPQTEEPGRCSVVSDSLWSHGLYPTRLLCPWGFSRQEYWSGLQSLLQGIFPTQGSNPSLLLCKNRILYHLRHWGPPGEPFRSDQIRSVAQSCLTLCDPMNRSTPGLPVHHQLLEFTQTHVHRVSDAKVSAKKKKKNHQGIVMYIPWGGTKILHYWFTIASALFLHFLTFLISNCLNLSFDIQGSFRRLKLFF